MESLIDVLHMLKPGVWMASVDLHHAYYSIPVAAHHQPYFSFLWQGAFYQYSCMPNGYAEAPMLFTKVLRPPFAYLRRQGHISVVYIDNTCLQGDYFVSCQRNVHATVNLLQDLGFNVNDKKYVFVPTQKLEFFGFILDSLLMTITLTARRKMALLNACSKLLQKSCQKIRVVSTVIGMVIAPLPGVKHGALHYRTLESENTAALRHNGDDYNGCVTISPWGPWRFIDGTLTYLLPTVLSLHPHRILQYILMLVWMGGVPLIH